MIKLYLKVTNISIITPLKKKHYMKVKIKMLYSNM